MPRFLLQNGNKISQGLVCEATFYFRFAISAAMPRSFRKATPLSSLPWLL